MSRIRRVLPAIFVVVLTGVATSSALAVDDPFYKVAGARLGAGESKELVLTAEGNQLLVLPSAGITITCTGIGVKKGATINGSSAPEAGTSTGVIEYSGCTVTGNGEKCVVTSVAKAKDKKIVSEPMKDELVFASSTIVKGTKDLDLLSVNIPINFEEEAGGKCKFASLPAGGTIAFEIRNSTKEAVAFGEHENEEEFGFIKALPNGAKACKLKEGKLDKCETVSLKTLLGSVTLEGTTKVKLATKQLFGVFNK